MNKMYVECLERDCDNCTEECVNFWRIVYQGGTMKAIITNEEGTMKDNNPTPLESLEFFKNIKIPYLEEQVISFGNVLDKALTDYTKQTEKLVEFIDVLIEHVEMDELSEVNDIIKDLKVIADINTILEGGKG
jgi:hypothetical protein